MFYYLSNYICIVKNISLLFHRLFYTKFKFIIKKVLKNDKKHHSEFILHDKRYIKI